jgi:repressor LexA
MLGEGEHYILNVRGESMIEAGIMDGDYVVVRKQPQAMNGDIVVAMIDDEATVKRFYKENGMFRLQPENPTMKPIIVPEVTILGKVVSLYRLY